MIRIAQTATFCAALAAPAHSGPTLAQTLQRDTGAPAAAVGSWTPEGRVLSTSGVEMENGPAISDDALWHLGSITKSMTALLVARLAEQGVIGWDDRLGDILGDALPDIPPAVQSVTYADLLTHRAGLPANEPRLRSIAQALFPSTAPLPRQRLAYVAATLGRADDPGAFLYSNAGYVTAAAMLETATGTPWETLIKRDVFTPLGLTTAGFGPPPAGPIGHRGERCRPVGRGPRADNPRYLAPAGGVHMSMDDLLTYLAAHAERPTSYLPPDAWARLHTPTGTYAMGWATDGDGLEHTGSNTMWFAQVHVAHDPPQALAAAINCGDGRAMVPLVQGWWASR